MEKDYSYLKEICDRQAEQLSRASLKLQEKASESDAEIKDMKETIFELEDQVEQHRAVKLHNKQLISELESKWNQAPGRVGQEGGEHAGERSSSCVCCGLPGRTAVKTDRIVSLLD